VSGLGQEMRSTVTEHDLRIRIRQYNAMYSYIILRLKMGIIETLYCE
jgi:hypothetical protein